MKINSAQNRLVLDETKLDESSQSWGDVFNQTDGLLETTTMLQGAADAGNSRNEKEGNHSLKRLVRVHTIYIWSTPMC